MPVSPEYRAYVAELFAGLSPGGNDRDRSLPDLKRRARPSGPLGSRRSGGAVQSRRPTGDAPDASQVGNGSVTIRRMFGGAGVFYDGLMFALIVDDTLYLKVDDTNRDKFADAGSRPFTFEKKKTGTTMLTSYYELPETLFDEPDALREWGRESVDVALRVDAKKKPKKRVR